MISAHILHPLIDLGSFPIYNLMIGISLIAAILIFQRNSSGWAYNTDIDYFILYMTLAAVLAFFSGSVFSSFLYPELKGMSIYSRILNAGFSFFPALLFFILYSYVLLTVLGLPKKELFHRLMPSIAAAHGIGRVGCSLAGCCYGIPVSFPFLERFPARELESIFALTLFFLFQTRLKENRLIIYLAYYSAFRFFLEIFRADSRGKLFTDSFSPTQELCIAVLIVLLSFQIVRISFQTEREVS